MVGLKIFWLGTLVQLPACSKYQGVGENGKLFVNFLCTEISYQFIVGKVGERQTGTVWAVCDKDYWW